MRADPELNVRSLFSTWIGFTTGPVQMNEALEGLAHELMADPRNASVRTNAGGWHYAFDLFALRRPLVDDLREELSWRVQAYLNQFRPDERKKEDDFRLEGWMNVNRAGDFNVLHCHPGCFVSATYYVKLPAEMRGGEIVFRDPRGPAVAMYETPKIELPWVGTGTGIPYAPSTGMLILFPSWLEHRVEPFEGEGERISIAFNATSP